MGRFGPTVLPTSGAAFASALGEGVDAYTASRLRKRQTEQEMFGHGLMLADPNAPPPSTTPQPAPSAVATVAAPTPANAALADALPAPTLKGRPTPSDIASGPVLSQPAQPPAPMLSAALQGPQTVQAKRQDGSVMDVPIHLLGRDWVMTPQAKAQMQLALALHAAQISKENSETYKNTREGGQARPGDANYAGVIGEVEGAKALATLPVEIQKLVAAGQISLQTGLALGRQRGAIEGGLQGQRQTFEMGQQGRAQTFQSGLETKKLEGARTNAIAEERNKEQGSFLAPLARAMHGESAPAAALPPLTAEQTARAAREPDYAAFLKAKGYP